MNRQHKELPGQLALDGLDTQPAPVQATRPKAPQPRSVAFSRCPYGNHGQLTGVFYHADCRLVFRDHLIRFASGAALVCRGSGQPVPDRHDVYEG
ncbi:MAG: hypothetical protein ACRDUA_19255 [Micromonosporaceae bacterium]